MKSFLVPNSTMKSVRSSTENNSTYNRENRDDNNIEGNPNFTNELKSLMYGFGDKENPDPESIELLQEYVIEYIQNLSYAAYRRSRRKGLNEISLKDLLYVLRKDKKRYYRIPNLIRFYEEMNKTKKNMSPSFRGVPK